jgi:hypothetical protein
MASRIIIDGQEHDFDFGNPSNKEIMLLEKVYGGTFKAWAEAMADGSITALTCLAYVVMKRTDPTLRFDDVEFAIGDGFRIEDDKAASEPVDPTEPTPSVGTA